MKNNFIVTLCRFHTKEKNKLLVMGYFDENFMDQNELSVRLDGKELSYTIDEKKRMTNDFVSESGTTITKDYFIWIELPENWRDGTEIQMTNVCNHTEQLAFEIGVAKLIKTEKKFAKFVEQVNIIDGGFVIKGWYIDVDNVKMSVYNMSNKALSIEIEKQHREDVEWVFPENTTEEIVVFEAKYKGFVPKRVRVHFESDEKQQDYLLQIRESYIKKFCRRLKNICVKTKAYYARHGVKATIRRAFIKVTNRETTNYQAWLEKHSPDKMELAEQRNSQFSYQPKISIVIPLYKTPLNYLDELIASIKAQTYSNWELCLSDGSGKNSPIKNALKKYVAKDSRIKVVYNDTALQISDNTNAALKVATGDYIAFADHDDLLAPNALYECVLALNDDKSIDALYTDEDKVDMEGKEHFMPHFKSDFNIDMLRSVNYICHLFVVKREIFEKVGLLNHEFDGAQDYDFVLRCAEACSNIKHIPKILYHWRAHKDSTAENPESKNYAFEAGARAIQAHYDRVGIAATVEETIHKGFYRSRYMLQSNPLVSIVIPNKDHMEDLNKCIVSIEEKSSYRNYEFIIVENNSTEEKTFEYYKKLEQSCPRAKVVYWKGKGFNYPAINNYGVEHAKGEYILLLNNDTEIINENCLEEMLGYCMREDVGAVGAKLYFEDGTIQHAGVIVGLGGVAGHTFVGFPHDTLGYFSRAQIAQNYSAVTAACVMIKKSVFQEVQGFDERYAVAFNDVDLCMKIRQAGYLIVFNPYAELNHYESKSRGYEDSAEKVKRFNSEIALFQSKWGDFLDKGDPYYNPNLTLDNCDFSLKE